MFPPTNPHLLRQRRVLLICTMLRKTIYIALVLCLVVFVYIAVHPMQSDHVPTTIADVEYQHRRLSAHTSSNWVGLYVDHSRCSRTDNGFVVSGLLQNGTDLLLGQISEKEPKRFQPIDETFHFIISPIINPSSGNTIAWHVDHLDQTFDLVLAIRLREMPRGDSLPEFLLEMPRQRDVKHLGVVHNGIAYQQHNHRVVGFVVRQPISWEIRYRPWTPPSSLPSTEAREPTSSAVHPVVPIGPASQQLPAAHQDIKIEDKEFGDQGWDILDRT